MRSIPAFVASALLATSLAAGQQQKDDVRGIEFFEKKIRPVLVQHCYRCHSEEAQQNKKLRGKLFLDTRAGLRQGGESGLAVIPGKAKESLLILALRHQGDIHMPPNGKLPDEVVADFVKWVDMGAPDPREGKVAGAPKTIDVEAGRKHWAFQPLIQPMPPQVKNAAWVRTPLDCFILAKLEEKKVAPNGPASREKLIRRAYFDLLGLPPTPTEVDAFVQDGAPDAYERLIDRLLASEHYGERWARHWLDLARFAESGGYEFDKDRPGAHHYRDFVIKALNQDMPFDEFVRWQVAGDLLKPGDFLATSATGFLVAGPFPGQTTAKTRELIRYNHLDDMVSTLGSAMLGMSIGCARCHDHKFDPIPQQDYYRLLACLSRTDSADLKMDPNPEVYRKAKAAFDQAHAPLLAARDKFEKEELPGRIRQWLQIAQEKPALPWQVLDVVEAKGKAPFKKLDDGSWLATGKAERNDVYTFVAHTYQKGITSIRLQALADMSLPKAGPGRGPDGNFLLTEVALTATPLAGKGKPTPIKLRAAEATVEPPGFSLKQTLDGDKKTGWSIGTAAGKDHAAVFETEGEASFEGGTVLTLTLKFENDGYALGRLRLALSTAPRPVKLDGEDNPQNLREFLFLVQSEKGQITPKNRESVVRWLRQLDPATDKVYGAVDQHLFLAPKPKLADVFAAASPKGGDVHFLIRGEVERKNGVAQPGFAQVLMTGPEQRWLGKALPKQAATVQPRVALASWLTDSEQGAGNLLARVIVNRLWQHHMGRGIVATSNDFGTQGEPPTHPDLLDYLACELVRNGWQLKAIHKLIMTSAVYVQSAEVNQAGLQVDRQNRLWWRHPPQRLEAEIIRDALLAAGGTLDRTMYGPGTLDVNNTRRSIYLTVKRSQMIPFLQMFDTPEAMQSIGERTTTTLATQALAFMNSPLVRKQAEKLAQLVRPKSVEGLPQAIERVYLIALSRRPTDSEKERMVAFVRSQTDRYSPASLDRALADACQAILCSNEFLYVD